MALSDKQQDIIWANVDPDLSRRMASVGDIVFTPRSHIIQVALNHRFKYHWFTSTSLAYVHVNSLLIEAEWRIYASVN